MKPICQDYKRKFRDARTGLPSAVVFSRIVRKSLPGKVEFTYLPRNTQAVVLVPIRCNDSTMVLALGSNQARSYTPQHLAWIQRVAQRLGATLGA
jgi:Cofactor assembly of complex C subunit B, CCB2/CCB4